MTNHSLQDEEDDVDDNINEEENDEHDSTLLTDAAASNCETLGQQQQHQDENKQTDGFKHIAYTPYTNN